MIKAICRTQNIKPAVAVYCPNCGNRTLLIDIKTKKSKCTVCDKEYCDINELNAIVQADFIDYHKATDYKMRNNRGRI